MSLLRQSESWGSASVRILRGWVSRRLARSVPQPDARRFRAAVVKLDRIGDAVLALGAVRTILQHYGETECLLVVSPLAEPIFAAVFPTAPRLVLPIAVMHRQLWLRGAEFRRRCAQFVCDDVISLRHQREDWDELVPLWLCGRRAWQLDPGSGGTDFIPARTFSWTGARRIAFQVPAAVPAGLCRELERHRQLLSAALGRPLAATAMRPDLGFQARGEARDFVLVTPFSSLAIRDFPRPLLISALQALRDRTRAPLRLYGDRGQRVRLEALATQARLAGVEGVEVLMPADAGGLVEAVGAARMVLTIDTVTAHLATAMDRPAVILMGGGHPGEFVPWGEAARQVWLTHEIECRGCDWQCRQPEPYCLTRVAPAALAAAVARVWATSGKAENGPQSRRD